MLRNYEYVNVVCCCLGPLFYLLSKMFEYFGFVIFWIWVYPIKVFTVLISSCSWQLYIYNVTSFNIFVYFMLGELFIAYLYGSCFLFFFVLFVCFFLYNVNYVLCEMYNAWPLDSCKINKISCQLMTFIDVETKYCYQIHVRTFTVENTRTLFYLNVLKSRMN